jgi:hypothetical protein
MTRATFARMTDQATGLRCSVHGCFLVLRRTVINTPRRGQRSLEIFACPVAGCKFMRANKWQGGGLRSRIAERRLEGRVDSVIDKIIGIVDKAMKPWTKKGSDL